MPHCTVRTDAGSLATRCGCAVDGVRAADARKDQSSRMHLTLRAEPRSGGRGQDRDWGGGRGETETEPLPKYSVPYVSGPAQADCHPELAKDPRPKRSRRRGADPSTSLAGL